MRMVAHAPRASDPCSWLSAPTFRFSRSQGGATTEYVTGVGPESVGTDATTGLAVPAPLALSASNVAEHNVSLVLTMPTADGYGLSITGFRVQICQELTSNGNPTCDPAYDFTTSDFTWTAGGTLLYIGPAGLEPEGVSGTLFEALSPQSDYRIRASAINSEGTGGWGGWLQVHTVHRPDQGDWWVQNAQSPGLMDSGPTYIQVRWTQPEDHGSPVQYYDLQYSIQGGSSYTEHITNGGNSLSRIYILSGLPNDQSVTFQVRAVNAYGASEWSVPITESTAGGTPSIATVNLASRSRTTMGWSWPSASGNGFAAGSYQVKVCKVSPSPCSSVSSTLNDDGCSNEVASAILPPDATSYEAGLEFSGAEPLEPYSAYVLRVRANSTGFPFFDSCINGAACPWATSACLYTRDFPSAPGLPRQKSNYGVLDNITHLYADWSGSSGRGLAVTNYEVRISYAGQPGIASMHKTQGATQYLVGSLAPETELTLAVRAYNSIGWGDWSGNATFVTAEAKPPEQPEQPFRAELSASSSNVTTIAVQWAAPVSIGIPILYYKVAVDGGNVDAAVTVPSSRTYYEQEGFENGTTHTFSVVAWNEKGRSEASPVATLSTWPGRVPQTPEPPTVMAHPSATDPAYSSATVCLRLSRSGARPLTPAP